MSAAYRVCQAAEVPVKSAQVFAQAVVVSVDVPKSSCRLAEGFLLSRVLERETPQIVMCWLDSERGRERCFLLICSFQKDEWRR